MTDPQELQLARSVDSALSVANSSMSLIARGRKEAASLSHDREPSEIAAIRNQAEQGDAEAQYTLAGELAPNWRAGCPPEVHADHYGPLVGELAPNWRAGCPQSTTVIEDGELLSNPSSDEAEAVHWFKLAAEQGHREAQYELGRMYESGQGVPQDYEEAARWFKLAAEQGHASAQCKLGYRYSLGQDVPEDCKEAMRWYKLAAEQGHASAQCNLGYMYYLGQGVPQDYVRAHMWFNLGGAADDPKGVYYRDIVAAKMTPAQIAEAQQLAQDWKPTTAK